MHQKVQWITPNTKHQPDQVHGFSWGFIVNDNCTNLTRSHFRHSGPVRPLHTLQQPADVNIFLSTPCHMLLFLQEDLWMRGRGCDSFQVLCSGGGCTEVEELYSAKYVPQSLRLPPPTSLWWSAQQHQGKPQPHTPAGSVSQPTVDHATITTGKLHI